MQNSFARDKAWRSPEIYKKISSIRSIKKKNLLRGYISKSHISPRDVEAIRRDNSPNDAMAIGALLKGENGLLGKKK